MIYNMIETAASRFPTIDSLVRISDQPMQLLTSSPPSEGGPVAASDGAASLGFEGGAYFG